MIVSYTNNLNTSKEILNSSADDMWHYNWNYNTKQFVAHVFNHSEWLNSFSKSKGIQTTYEANVCKTGESKLSNGCISGYTP
jgi:hypothetical protein